MNWTFYNIVECPIGINSEPILCKKNVLVLSFNSVFQLVFETIAIVSQGKREATKISQQKTSQKRVFLLLYCELHFICKY